MVNLCVVIHWYLLQFGFGNHYTSYICEIMLPVIGSTNFVQLCLQSLYTNVQSVVLLLVTVCAFKDIDLKDLKNEL